MIAGRSWSDTAENTSQVNPIEIGLVHWGRDLDAALEQSGSSGKPVLVLFQEVPGCAGCRKFGREVLSHPLVVEAIEEEFIPVVVYNNRSTGNDAQWLARFNEPAWNYQVIRFLDKNARDLVPRKDGVWSVGGVVSRMIDALQASGRPVPKYLRTVAAVNDRSETSEAAFAMSCFWTGEYRLGGIEGVITTEAGWLDGREVTRVRFDKSQLSLDSLAHQGCPSEMCQEDLYPRGPDSSRLARRKTGRELPPSLVQ